MKAALLLAGAVLAGVAHADDKFDLNLRQQVESRYASVDSSRSVQAADLRWQWDAPGQNALRGVFTARRAEGELHWSANELALERPLGAGFLTAGKKVLSWDVGYAFRPLDVVQQEDRRALYAPSLEGVPLLAWEWFDAERAVTVVWSNPGKGRADQPKQDSALAVRLYRRNAGRDEYAVLRLSRRNGIEGGVSFSDVVGEALELHGSVLLQQRHEQWGSSLTGAAIATHDPFQWQQHQGGAKLLAGLTYTTATKFSLFAEAWYEGAANSSAQWDAWRSRNQALPRAAAPPALIGANLAWNSASLQTSSLRRQNLWLRGGQDIGEFNLAADVLYMPEDGGRISSLVLGWHSGPWSASANLRHYGGAAHSIVRAVPLRATAVLVVQRAF